MSAIMSQNRLACLSADILESVNPHEANEELKQKVQDSSKDVSELGKGNSDPTDAAGNVDISESINLIDYNISLIESENAHVAEATEDILLRLMNESMELEQIVDEAVESESSDKTEKEISNTVDKSEDNIKKVGAKLNKSVLDLRKSDKKKFDKYNSIITLNNLDGFVGIKNFNFPVSDIDLTIKKIIDTSKVDEALRKYTDEVTNAETKEEVDTAIDEFDIRIKSIIDDCYEDIKSAMKKHEVFIPSTKDIVSMKKFINGNEIQDNIKSSTKEIISGLRKMQKEAEESANKVKENKNLLSYKMIMIYRGITGVIKALNRKFSAYKDLITKEIASYRSAFLSCGRYCYKNTQNVTESTETQNMYTYSVVESSNMYVYDKFE